MASISREPNGRWVAQFVDRTGRRRSIRLGRLTEREAANFRDGVDNLLAARRNGSLLDRATARWAADLPDGLANKLAKYDLVEPRQQQGQGAVEKTTVERFIDGYISGRANLKPNTRRNYDQTRRYLVQHFGGDRELASITPGDADQWREEMLKAGLSQATVNREAKRVRQFFRAAVRHKLIAENPFSEVKGGGQENRSRQRFIDRETAKKVLDACPSLQWRLMFCLARFGGIRVPSELGLKWADIDWAGGKVLVHSPKTEAHPNGGSRQVPLFPELREVLSEAFDPEAVYVIEDKYRSANQNLRTGLMRIIERASLTPWPKLWANLRASRATELTQQFPAHVAASWLGHSTQVAAKHYWQVTEEDFARAAGNAEPDAGALQNRVQQGLAGPCDDSQTKRQEPVFAGSCDDSRYCANVPVPPRGSEQPAILPRNIEVSILRAAESCAVPSAIPTVDPELDEVIDRWPALSAEARQQVLAIVRQSE